MKKEYKNNRFMINKSIVKYKMPGLLVDRKVLVKHKLKKLLDISGPAPKTKDDVGVIFLIPDKQYNDLVELKKGDEKLSYIQSTSFVNSIRDSYFIVYNKKKKICEIRGHIDNPEHLNSILESITTYMPDDVTVWAGVIPIEKSNHYIKAGFDNPHIVDHSPLKHTFNRSGVAFSMGNRDKKVSETSVRNKLIHASTQTGSLCNIYARFTPKAISYLKKINNPSVKKELAGALTVSNVSKDTDDKLVFELSPEPHTEKIGDDENVNAVWSRYNFHTHPKKAYENHGVTRGWPSSQDYVGFLQLNNHTIFHTVVTLEGIYVISLSPEWKGDVSKVNKKYVLEHYDIDHKDKISFSKYVEIINKKRYKGSKLFVVKFMPWNKSTGTFPVFYAKTGNKCLATEEAFKMYEKN